MIGELIDEQYLYSDEIDEKALQDGIYSGYVSGLGDPYTVYYDEEQTNELLESTTGEYSGVGALLSQDLMYQRILINFIDPLCIYKFAIPHDCHRHRTSMKPA